MKEVGDMKFGFTSDTEMQSFEFAQMVFGLALVYYSIIMMFCFCFLFFCFLFFLLVTMFHQRDTPLFICFILGGLLLLLF